MSLRFDDGWREQIVLRDGTVARLRLVQPADKTLFLEGWEHLSSQSRYLRFFTGKDQLSEGELRYLTEVDGMNHLAIGAEADGQRGLGVARFVRLSEEPEVAEIAVTVIDDMQHKGLGRALLERLVAAAAERGLHRFRAEILSSNAPMLALIEGLSPRVTPVAGGTLVVDFTAPGALQS